MANSVELKSRGFDDGIDSNDPLMELSRIIGLSPSHAPQPKAPDPQLSIEDSFALDLERELTEPVDPVELDFADELLDAVDDDLSSAMDLGERAPPVEPSLEDELSALLGDNEPQSETGVAYDAPAEARPAFPEAGLFDDLSAEDDFEAIEPVGAETDVEQEMTFDSEEWLDVPLEASSDEVAVEPELEYEAEVHDDPVFSEMTRPHLARDDRPLVMPEPISAADDVLAQNTSVDMPEPEADFESESGFGQPEVMLAAEPFAEEPALDPEMFDPVAEMAELDLAEPEAFSPLPDLDEGQVTAFKPEQEFEQLLARTAPQPVVEPVDSLPDAIDAVEEFDIPDFEFEPEPVAEADPAFTLEDDFADVAAPASTWKDERPLVGAATPAEDDFDFDSIVDEELAVAADSGNNLSAYTGALAAAGAGYAATRASAQHPNPVGLDPDLDIFREDNAEASYQDNAPRRRNWMAAAAVVGAIVVAGAGAMWVFSGSPTTTTDGNVALVKADPEPVKIAPENPGGKVVANQDKAVYDQVSGQQDALPNGGQLVSESEEPLDIAAATPAEAETGKSEARVDPNGTVEAASGQAVDTLAITPKKVKTFIVKPDGTLVERPAEAAPAVEQAAAPAAPAEPAAPTETVAAVAPAPAPVEPVAAAPEPVAEAPKPVETAAVPAEPVAAPVEPEAPAAAQPAEPAIKVVKTKKIKAPEEAAPVEQAAAAPAATDAPIAERPAEQPVDIVGQTGGQQGQEQQVAAIDPAAAAQPVAGGYSIQIASTPSPEAAKATYAALTRKFGNVISGRGVNILKADVAGKGTVYRVRIPVGSRSEANALCAKYKSAGGSCFVSK